MAILMGRVTKSGIRSVLNILQRAFPLVCGGLLRVGDYRFRLLGGVFLSVKNNLAHFRFRIRQLMTVFFEKGFCVGIGAFDGFQTIKFILLPLVQRLNDRPKSKLP